MIHLNCYFMSWCSVDGVVYQFGCSVSGSWDRTRNARSWLWSDAYEKQRWREKNCMGKAFRKQCKSIICERKIQSKQDWVESLRPWSKLDILSPSNRKPWSKASYEESPTLDWNGQALAWALCLGTGWWLSGKNLKHVVGLEGSKAGGRQLPSFLIAECVFSREIPAVNLPGCSVETLPCTDTVVHVGLRSSSSRILVDFSWEDLRRGRSVGELDSLSPNCNWSRSPSGISTISSYPLVKSLTFIKNLLIC